MFVNAFADCIISDQKANPARNVYTSKISSSVIVALVGPMIGFYFGEKKREVE